MISVVFPTSSQRLANVRDLPSAPTTGSAAAWASASSDGRTSVGGTAGGGGAIACVCVFGEDVCGRG